MARLRQEMTMMLCSALTHVTLIALDVGAQCFLRHAWSGTVHARAIPR